MTVSLPQHADDTLEILPQVERILVGKSARMKDLKRAISCIAPSGSSVMVQGPTGSGKELVAEAIHHGSGRPGKFIAINCAAVPGELLESELFGHEKGSFTGADKKREGLIEAAEGGTLFLDEIGDMPLSLQSKLLRVLESRTIRRVGGNDDFPVNFRLITATHRDLAKSVEEGEFRADLFYRIGVFPVCVPPLCERTSDLPVLLDYMINKYCEDTNTLLQPHFTLDALRVLGAYSWPGNVRELRNVVERAMVFFLGQVITDEHVRDNLLVGMLPQEGAEKVNPSLELGVLPSPETFRGVMNNERNLDLRGYLRDVEAVLIEDAVLSNNGYVSHAAEKLGLQRTTLIEKMKKLGINRV